MNKSLITTTKPIPLAVVTQIKELLQDSPRELAWFTLSVNSAFRGGDILEIRRDELNWLSTGCLEIQTRERKTGKLRKVILNETVAVAISAWLARHPKRTEFLFEGTRGKMNTSYWSQLLKKWCSLVDFNGDNIATHSLRKTFVKTHYERGVKLATLMYALNHGSERQTLQYVGILAEDVAAVYADAI